ncbi:MAG: inorganic phosphate transporter [Nitrospirota bacterium]|jgi:PiT family inorganic phosphate transporter|nr:inorganic phosphate transporter [Nitrospirota bacterium]
MDISLLAFALVFALAFANGSNDVSKAIATLVGSGVTDYRSAIAWGTIWTVVGAALAAFVASAMVKTFSHGLVRTGTIIEPSATLAVLTGAMAWVLFASHTGLPVSTTHALTGAIVGTGFVAFAGEGLIWAAIGKKIALPLLLSPFLAFTVSILVHPAVRVLARKWEGSCLCVMPAARALVAIDALGGTRTLFQTSNFGLPVMAVPSQCNRAGLQGVVVGLDTIHWISSGLASFARGTNDAPKIVAMLLLGSATAAWPSTSFQLAAFGGVALAMGLGSYFGGLRVTEVLAEKVTRMDHAEGLSANLTTSSLVLLSGSLGLPVSTTHVSSSAIIGIGLLKGLKAIRWMTVRDMVLAWVVTLPASAILAALTYLLLSRIL